MKEKNKIRKNRKSQKRFKNQLKIDPSIHIRCLSKPRIHNRKIKPNGLTAVSPNEFMEEKWKKKKMMTARKKNQ